MSNLPVQMLGKILFAVVLLPQGWTLPCITLQANNSDMCGHSLDQVSRSAKKVCDNALLKDPQVRNCHLIYTASPSNKPIHVKTGRIEMQLLKQMVQEPEEGCKHAAG